MPPRKPLALLLTLCLAPAAFAQTVLRPVGETPPAGGAGLFVGVNEFTDPTGRVGNLRFAVNDAVSLAHLFVRELRLIPAANCTLALAGRPSGEEAERELAALTAAGVRVTGATKSVLLDGLFRVSDAAARGGAGGVDPDGVPLVIVISSHGFTEGRDPYLMPADGRRRRLSDTALRLATVEEEAGKSAAGHRLLLIDACQERVGGEKSLIAAGGAAAMSPAFAAAFARPTGQVKIASCDAGEYSVEVTARRHGAFTAAFLDSLRGAATDRDGDGVIRLSDVEPVMVARVAELVEAYNRGVPAAERVEQSPTFHGPLAARRLPLAVPTTDAAVLIGRLAARIGRNGYTAALHARVAASLTAGTLPAPLRAEAERFVAGRSPYFARIIAPELATVTPGDMRSPTMSKEQPVAAAGGPVPMRLRTIIPEPRVLRGHMGGITAVAALPDGLRAVTASKDNTLRVWKLSGIGEPEVLSGHAMAVLDVAVTPDGHWVVSASLDETLRVWDLVGDGEPRILGGNVHSVSAVAVTPDGQRAISGSLVGTLLGWDLFSGGEFWAVSEHTHEINDIAVASNGQRAVSGSHDRTLRVWDPADGEQLVVLRGHEGAVNAVAVTPNGRQAVSGSADGTLRVWDLDRGGEERVLRGHEGTVTAVAVTPDSRRVVSGSVDRTLRVWDLETGVCERMLDVQTDRAAAAPYRPYLRGRQRGSIAAAIAASSDVVSAVAITPDGRYIISGSVHGAVRIWDAFEPDR